MAIEKKFVREQINRLLIKEFLMGETERAGFGGLDIQRTPMGTRVSLIAERPGMIIGRRGSNITRLTADLAANFKAENPQIEVIEAGRDANLNANIMARKVAEALERGWHFRRAGHSTVRRIMESGAKGCIVILSGKLTGQRHRVEKFIAGHIKYNGDTALQLMDVGYSQCKKKLGTIGCTVKIMHPDARLPDEVTIFAPGEKELRAAASRRPERPAATTPAEEKPEGAGEAKSDGGAPTKGEFPEEDTRERRPRRREPTPQPSEADIKEAEAMAKRRAAERAKKDAPAAEPKAEAKPEPKAEAAVEKASEAAQSGTAAEVGETAPTPVQTENADASTTSRPTPTKEAKKPKAEAPADSEAEAAAPQEADASESKTDEKSESES